MNESAQSPDAGRDLFGTLEKLTAALAGAAALVYLTGGLALQLRLEPSGCRRQRRFHSCRASSSSAKAS
jgi:hypothetical protein